MQRSEETLKQAVQEPDAWVVYDGECPFCSEYVRLVRLRDSIGNVQLVNARESHPVVDEIVKAGYDLNEGMVLKLNGKLYHGADCIHMLAMLSSSKGLFNRVNVIIFRSPLLSKVLYPVLRTGRNTLLRMLGRSKINKEVI